MCLNKLIALQGLRTLHGETLPVVKPSTSNEAVGVDDGLLRIAFAVLALWVH